MAHVCDRAVAIGITNGNVTAAVGGAAAWYPVLLGGDEAVAGDLGGVADATGVGAPAFGAGPWLVSDRCIHISHVLPLRPPRFNHPQPRHQILRRRLSRPLRLRVNPIRRAMAILRSLRCFLNRRSHSAPRLIRHPIRANIAIRTDAHCLLIRREVGILDKGQLLPFLLLGLGQQSHLLPNLLLQIVQHRLQPHVLLLLRINLLLQLSLLVGIHRVVLPRKVLLTTRFGQIVTQGFEVTYG